MYDQHRLSAFLILFSFSFKLYFSLLCSSLASSLSLLAFPPCLAFFWNLEVFHRGLPNDFYLSEKELAIS